MDQTIKIWDLKKPQYEDDPLIIYDHEDEVICADIRVADGLLMSMDIQGTVLIRSLADPETVLHTITSIAKEVEDFARVLFNSQRP
jgi:hypothetical protein